MRLSVRRAKNNGSTIARVVTARLPENRVGCSTRNLSEALKGHAFEVFYERVRDRRLAQIRKGQLGTLGLGGRHDDDDHADEQEPHAADLAVARNVELVLVVGRARHAHEPTGDAFAVAQVAQRLGNLAPAFGLIGSSPLKIAAAARVISSSASSSSIRR